MNALLVAHLLNLPQIKNKPVPVVMPVPIVKLRKTIVSEGPLISIEGAEPKIGLILVTQDEKCFILEGKAE